MEKGKEKKENKAMDEVSEIQDYLRERGIHVSETAIIKAAIRLATRFNTKEAFICECTELGPWKGGRNRNDVPFLEPQSADQANKG